MPASPARSRRRCAFSSPARRRCSQETFDEFEARTGHAHPRALRHDRDRHERLQPAAWRAPRRHRRAGRCRGSSCGSPTRPAGALPAGETGVLEVRGPNVFKGYWRLPEKTAEEFRADGFFITGDIATIDADGYVTIVGRAKDLIISGGFNVYPKEVESVLDAQAGVAESAVIGVPHPDFGEGVLAVVSAAVGASAGRRGAARRDCATSSRRSRRPSAWCSSTSCRATAWARCRRTCCARPTATPLWRGLSALLLCSPAGLPVGVGCRRIGAVAGRAHALDRAALVLLGAVAADPDGADHRARAVPDQDPARHRALPLCEFGIACALPPVRPARQLT